MVGGRNRRRVQINLNLYNAFKIYLNIVLPSLSIFDNFPKLLLSISSSSSSNNNNSSSTDVSCNDIQEG
jgi:hypothetical protein